MTYEYTPTGWYATFDRNRHPQRFAQAPVVTWSPDGDALVVNEKKGCLVSANQIPGFKELRPSGRIVQVITAAEGWELETPARDSDPAFKEPVIAWAVDEDGNALPITALWGEGSAGIYRAPEQTLWWNGTRPTTTVDHQSQDK